MELGLGFHQLAVHPSECWVVAEGERVVDRLVDRIVGISSLAVEMGDRVTRSTGDASPGCRIVDVVEVRVIELAPEEDNRVVAAGTESCRLHRAVPFQGDLSGLFDRKEIGRIVEGGEAMGADRPGVVTVFVTLLAVLVIHQDFG